VSTPPRPACRRGVAAAGRLCRPKSVIAQTTPVLHKQRIIAAFMRMWRDIANRWGCCAALSRGSSAADRRSPPTLEDSVGCWRARTMLDSHREVPSVAPNRRFGDLGKSKRIGQKVRAGAKPALTQYNKQTGSYPFVTTGGGGGALPLPTWALAATLRRASTAAVARASFFMRQTLHFATSP
jgi:hypothetical protein